MIALTRLGFVRVQTRIHQSQYIQTNEKASTFDGARRQARNDLTLSNKVKDDRGQRR